MKSTPALLLVAAASLFGCTSVKVQPVQSTERISSVVIRENPKVAVNDFLDVLVDGFQRHGIATRVVHESADVGDAYVVTYVAYRKWDLKPYLVDATISIFRNNRRIATADYHLRGGGGFSLMKWQGTRTKIGPVIDELLKDISPLSPDEAATATKAHDIKAHLKVVKQLLDEGFITEEEYNTRRKEIIAEEGGEPSATDNPNDAQ